MSLPTPEPGLVVSYSYLWSEESEQGLVEGRKDRPCAIVLVIQSDPEGKAPQVVVAPITHSPPRDRMAAVEIPLAVKRHLDLDDLPSWVIVNDFNVFRWPGYDLRPNRKGEYAYGVLPPSLFKQIIQRFTELRQQQRTVMTSRENLNLD